MLPLDPPGLELDEALGQVGDFYRSNGLPAVFQIPEDSPGTPLGDLDAELSSRGWSSYNTASVMTAPLSVVSDRCPAAMQLPQAQLAPVPSAAWLRGYLYRGRPLTSSAVEVLVNAELPIFAAVGADGADFGAGQPGVGRRSGRGP